MKSNEELEYEYRYHELAADLGDPLLIAALRPLEYMRNACVRCGGQKEDWHNKLCGDEFCAKCSLWMDQFNDNQDVQTEPEVSASSQRRDASASQRKATR